MIEQPLEHTREPEGITTPLPAWISQETRSTLEALTDERGQAQLVAYARGYLERYPQVAEALFIGEELGGKAKQDRLRERAAKTFSGRDVHRGEIWIRAGEHSIALGMMAEMIARKMGLPDDAVARVALAGGLHDFWKKREMAAVWDAEDRLAKQGTPVTTESAEAPEVVMAIREAFDTTQREDEAMLKSIDIPEDVIRLSKASRIQDLAGPATPEELIIFYLHYSLAGVTLKSMAERLGDSFRKNPSYLAYYASFKDQLGGRMMHELLLEPGGLGEHIERTLAKRLGYDGDPSKLHEYLTQLFVETVRNA